MRFGTLHSRKSGSYLAKFSGKASLLDGDDVAALTSHPPGGVCPFGLATPIEIFCDESLKVYDEVVPAAGSRNSAVRIAPQRMADLVGAVWIAISKSPERGSVTS